jgi:hypothetical protein
LDQPEPLRPELQVHRADAGDVTTRPIEAGDETNLQRVRTDGEDDRNCHGRGFCRQCRWRAARCGDDGHPPADDISRQFWQSIELIVREAVFDPYVLSFDIADLA